MATPNPRSHLRPPRVPPRRWPPSSSWCSFSSSGWRSDRAGRLHPARLPRPSPVSVGPSRAPGTGAPRRQAAPLPSGRCPANFGLFFDALRIIRQNFVGRDDLTDQQITYGAIRGTRQRAGRYRSLDLPHSRSGAGRERVAGRPRGRCWRAAGHAGRPGGRRVGDQRGTGRPRRHPDAVTRSWPSTASRSRASSPKRSRPRFAATPARPWRSPLSDLPPGSGSTSASCARSCTSPPRAGRWCRARTIGLLRLIQFSSGAADELRTARDAGAGRRRDVADPRPAQQSGRLRQRSRRHGQPFPFGAASSTSESLPTTSDCRCRLTRRFQRPMFRWSCSSTRAPRARPRSSLLPSAPPAAPSSSARPPLAPEPCCSTSTCPMAPPSGSRSSAG